MGQLEGYWRQVYSRGVCCGASGSNDEALVPALQQRCTAKLNPALSYSYKCIPLTVDTEVKPTRHASYKTALCRFF